jgi:uncharacterized protein YebE (UPF0316 family)
VEDRIVCFAIGSVITQPFILPVLVFLAETCVVTLSTIRTICISRGRKVLSASLGFFEISIWLFAIGQIMQNLSNLNCYIAFASGFCLGNFLGIVIEQKMALGNVVVQITTKKRVCDLVNGLRSANYGVTTLDAHGATGPVQVAFTVIKRKEIENVVSVIKRFDPKAFYSVNDLQSATEGIYPDTGRRSESVVPSILLPLLPPARFKQKALNGN